MKGGYREALYALWNDSVEPYPVIEVMRARQERGDDGAEALLEKALTLSGSNAASLLMEPVAEALPWKQGRRRTLVHQAISALVRAGGDPTPVLPAIFARFDVENERRPSSSILRGAALRGWPIPEDAFPECRRTDEHVRAAWRLARLQTIRPACLGLLATVYRSHRVSNLFPGVAMVEEALLSDDASQASDALVSLAEAGADLFAAWVALLPILVRGLGQPDQRRQAAHTLIQVRFSFEDSEDRDTKGRVPTLVSAAIPPLADGLVDEEITARTCAEALSVLSGLGADLTAVRGSLEAASLHESVRVREHVSTALSQWLLQTGEEAPLPVRCSHRRIFSASDARIDGNHRAGCVACKGDAVPIYYAEDISQTHADIRLEVRCLSCGLYSWHSWGY